MHKNTVNTVNNISFSIISVVVGLLPFFFLPSTVSGIGAVKGVVLYVGVLAAFSLWVVGHFLEGSLRVIKHPVFLALLAWVVLSFVSALTSRNVSVSLWGRGFALDSFATTGVFGMLVLLVALFSSERQKLVRLFLASFIGAVAMLVVQIALYAAQSTSFVSKYFSGVASQGTLVGTWVDFAYFTVFVFLLGLLSLEILAPKKLLKAISIAAVSLSLFVLVFLNFTIAWVIAIAAALLAFVYKSSIERSAPATKKTKAGKEADAIVAAEGIASSAAPTQYFPLVSFISLLIGLFFYLSSNSIGATLASYAHLTFSDIRPSFATTTHVMRATLAHDPIFGAGAGRYGEMWNLYHPVDINKTVFWNSSFDGGFSFVQSVFTTNGIVPVLAFLAFLYFSLGVGFKLLKQRFSDSVVRFIAIASFIISIGFASLLFLSFPGIVIMSFGFIYLGMLIGLSVVVGDVEVVSFNYLKDPRTSFFAILILVIAAMAGFSATYFSGNRFASVVYYNRALFASDATTAQARIDRAIALSPNDIYWRTRTALFTNQFTSAAGQQNADKSALMNYFTQAEQSANAAVAWDTTNANNWLTLSQVYQLVASGNNADAYNNGKKAAAEAHTRNPNNPVFFLNDAQLALTQQGNTQSALDSIAKALALKGDYLDAYVMRGQIQKAGGDAKALENELVNYVRIARSDEQGYVLLSQAAGDLKDYPMALAALGQARQLDPNNPNYSLQYIAVLNAMGNKEQAIIELQSFKVHFPGIAGVDDQIKRIQNESSSAAPAATISSAGDTAASPAPVRSVTKKKKR